MGYDYSFEYAFPDAVGGAAEGMVTGAVGIVAGVLLIVYFLAMAFSVVSYVLGAVGTYRIAKRRGIHHAWLAWIPVGSNWLLGSISDHYQYVAKQKTTKRRKILLILSLILMGITVLFTVAVVVGIFASTGISSGTTGAGASIATIILMVVYYWAILGLGITITVFSYIACYDLFQSCKPGQAVLFLVLSVLFNVTQPFFVFACSNSDQGMPARRPKQPPMQIPFEEPQPAEPEEEIPVVEAEIVEDPEL